MNEKKLDDLYDEHHQIEEEIKRREAMKKDAEEIHLKDLEEHRIELRLGIQHREDLRTVGFWCTVCGVVGIGLGLLIAWIF